MSGVYEAPNPHSPPNSVVRLALLGLFLATGLVLSLFELYIPRPLPWAKPGLANAVILLAIYLFGLPDALLIAVARVVLVSLWAGSFAGPGFVLAAGATLVSTLAMYLSVRLLAPHIGPIGVSMIGAFCHVLTQIALAGALIVGRWQILQLLPLFVWPAFFSGLIVGIFTFVTLRQFRKRFALRYALPDT